MRFLHLTCGLVVALFFACGHDEPQQAAPSSADGAVDDSSAADAATTNDGGPGAGVDLSEHSGTRIKLEYATSADGFRARTGLYDAQLNVHCNALNAADNVRRCLPQSAVASFFADDQCAQRVATWNACDARPTHAMVVEDSATACGAATFKMLALGADVTPTTLYYKSGSTCAVLEAAQPSQKYAALGAELPPTTFAEVTSKKISLAPNLDAAFAETADGLHAFDTMQDPSHGGVPCHFIEAADGSRRCITQSFNPIVAGKYFSDSSCSMPLANDSKCPNFGVARSAGAGCDKRTRVYRLGATHQGPALFQSSGDGGCAGTTLEGGAFFEVTEIPPTELALETPLPSKATTRLHTDTWQLPGGETVEWSFGATPAVIDSAKDTSCHPGFARDGKVRCLPDNVLYTQSFADDACTVPVGVVPKTQCGAVKYAQYDAPASSGSSCTASYAYRPLLGKRSSGVVYTRGANGTTCTAADVSAASDVYDLGPEVSDTDWVELSTVHDP